MKEVKQRRRIANYLSVDNIYVLMNAGFTELDESPSAKTTSKRYIGDSSETKTITSYDWSTDFTTDQIRSEKAIDAICNIGELCLTGSDAETDYLIVDLDNEGTSPNTFKARKIRVAIEVKDFKSKDGEMAASGSLLGKGDPLVGTFDVTAGSFSIGFAPATLGVLTLTSLAGTLSGTTKITATPALTVGNSYKYITDVSISKPLYGDVCTSGYTSWNGASDITAVTGNQILIVEVDSNNRALKTGVITVVSKA